MLTNLGTEEDKEKGKKLGAIDYVRPRPDSPRRRWGDKVREYLK